MFFRLSVRLLTVPRLLKFLSRVTWWVFFIRHASVIHICLLHTPTFLSLLDAFHRHANMLSQFFPQVFSPAYRFLVLPPRASPSPVLSLPPGADLCSPADLGTSPGPEPWSLRLRSSLAPPAQPSPPRTCRTFICSLSLSEMAAPPGGEWGACPLLNAQLLQPARQNQCWSNGKRLPGTHWAWSLRAFGSERFSHVSGSLLLRLPLLPSEEFFLFGNWTF